MTWAQVEVTAEYLSSYEHRGGAAYVHVCGNRRFDRGLEEITEEIGTRIMVADILAREIATLRAKEQTTDTVRAIEIKQWSLDRETEAVNNLSAFHTDTKLNWSQKDHHRSIGYIQFAPAVTVDVQGGTLFTSDWGVFVAAEGKVKSAFEGNVVYLGVLRLLSCLVFTSDPTTTLKFFLGTKYTPQQLKRMFYPIDGGPTTFKFPMRRVWLRPSSTP